MSIAEFFSMEPAGQGLPQLAELLLAFLLSSAIGLEREYKLKSAGLRTHALVGLAAALMMLVSKYGFADVLEAGRVVLDPSRVAAQVVSGIGFIGGGLIFVRKDIVRGLTTAAVVWLTAGVGMACGAGLPVLAICATAGHFFVVYGYTFLITRIVGAHDRLYIVYQVGYDAVGTLVSICAERKFMLTEFAIDRNEERQTASLSVTIQGGKNLPELVDTVAALPFVLSVTNTRQEETA